TGPASGAAGASGAGSTAGGAVEAVAPPDGSEGDGFAAEGAVGEGPEGGLAGAGSAVTTSCDELMAPSEGSASCGDRSTAGSVGKRFGSRGLGSSSTVGLEDSPPSSSSPSTSTGISGSALSSGFAGNKSPLGLVISSSGRRLPKRRRRGRGSSIS